RADVLLRRLFFFSSRRRHTRSVSAFLLNRSSDLAVAWKDQVYAQNEMLAYQQKESTARVASIMENTNLSKQQQVSEIMRQMLTRSEERRVGKECRSHWSQAHK